MPPIDGIEASTKTIMDAADKYAFRAWMHGEEKARNREALLLAVQVEIANQREAARQEIKASALRALLPPLPHID